MFSFIFKRKKHENKPFRSNMSMSERQREWDRKCEREAQKAREEGLSREEANKIVYYKKKQPKTTCKAVQKRSPSNAVAPKKKRWKDTTESERRRQVREREPFVKKMVKDVGKAGQKALDGISRMVDNYDRYYAKREREARKATRKTTRKATTKKVTMRKAATKKVTVRKAATKKVTVRKATAKKVTVRKATAKPKTAKKRTVKRRK